MFIYGGKIDEIKKLTKKDICSVQNYQSFTLPSSSSELKYNDKMNRSL